MVLWIWWLVKNNNTFSIKKIRSWAHHTPAVHGKFDSNIFNSSTNNLKDPYLIFSAIFQYYLSGIDIFERSLTKLFLINFERVCFCDLDLSIEVIFTWLLFGNHETSGTLFASQIIILKPPNDIVQYL